MSKTHRDNHEARISRGPEAFAKKVTRRKPMSRCNLCGTKCRQKKLFGGICPKCYKAA